MFTVKHIAVTGEEILKEAEEDVTCGYPIAAQSSNSREVTFTDRKGRAVAIDSGDVYVMNENGRTVATYHLGNPNAVGVADGTYAGINEGLVHLHPFRANSYTTRKIAIDGDTTNATYPKVSHNS